MNVGKTFSMETRALELLGDEALKRHMTAARVLEQLIYENCAARGLIMECKVCGASYSELCKECPQCKITRAKEVEEDTKAKTKKRIKNLKVGIERVNDYTPEQIEALKTELAELEKP